MRKQYCIMAKRMDPKHASATYAVWLRRSCLSYCALLSPACKIGVALVLTSYDIYKMLVIVTRT